VPSETPMPSETPTPTPDPEEDPSLLINGQSGTPVYYTNMVSNIHAGREFYLDSLKENYGLEFSSDFAQVMEEIETEYKKSHKLVDTSDKRSDGLTSSWDDLLVRNWQDILAVYVYEQKKENPKQEVFVLDGGSRERLTEIFEEMNPVKRDKTNITRATYGNYHINDYIRMKDIPKEDRELLKKYVETDCKLLCAVVTAAKGFVRQSVGDDVSEERVNVIAAAYSLVGKIGYFWGGKSNAIGMDPSWGTIAAESHTSDSEQTASQEIELSEDGAEEEEEQEEQTTTVTTLKAYGLDCSGFVTWAVINGYLNKGMEGVVGHGTTTQWNQASVISEAEAQPGDLVFQSGPEAGSSNHVGIICGKTDAGDWIAVHCSSSANGVTVGEAYSASFRYIRQPVFYPSEEELAEIEDSKESGKIEIENNQRLQDLIGQVQSNEALQEEASLQDFFDTSETDSAVPEYAFTSGASSFVEDNDYPAIIQSKPENTAQTTDTALDSEMFSDTSMEMELTEGELDEPTEGALPETQEEPSEGNTIVEQETVQNIEPSLEENSGFKEEAEEAMSANIPSVSIFTEDTNLPSVVNSKTGERVSVRSSRFSSSHKKVRIFREDRETAETGSQPDAGFIQSWDIFSSSGSAVLTFTEDDWF
ncbi:MAG: NlpC/P60 family protein, partial [Eubacteriales bacterium]|nr:NlpC/P60 family protein [Eubacteriales bacterium]